AGPVGGAAVPRGRGRPGGDTGLDRGGPSPLGQRPAPAALRRSGERPRQARVNGRGPLPVLPPACFPLGNDPVALEGRLVGDVARAVGRPRVRISAALTARRPPWPALAATGPVPGGPVDLGRRV